MKTEAGMGGMQPQVKGFLEPPEAGRGRRDPPLELRLHSLWSLVPAALGTLTHRCQGHVHALYGPQVPGHKGTGQPPGFISKTL